MFFTWPSKSWFASTPLHVPMVLVGGHSFEARRAASRREKHPVLSLHGKEKGKKLEAVMDFLFLNSSGW